MARTPFAVTGKTMGTRYSVRALIEGDGAGLVEALQAAVDRVDQQMSNWKTDSVLSQFNTASVGTWVEIPEQFADVIRIGSQVAADTDGAFDMTLGELVNLWGFGPAGRVAVPPDSARIEEAILATGPRKIELREDGRALRRLTSLQLDLCGIAKGYGVDELARVLIEGGITNFVADIDGELRVSGKRADGRDWRVAVALPVPRLLAAYAAIEPGTMAVATSGDYRHVLELGGRTYSHTIDSRTGGAAISDIASATVLDPSSCARADAIASALMVMGWQSAQDWCDRAGVSAILLRRAGEEIEARLAGPRRVTLV